MSGSYKSDTLKTKPKPVSSAGPPAAPLSIGLIVGGALINLFIGINGNVLPHSVCPPTPQPRTSPATPTAPALSVIASAPILSVAFRGFARATTGTAGLGISIFVPAITVATPLATHDVPVPAPKLLRTVPAAPIAPAVSRTSTIPRLSGAFRGFARETTGTAGIGISIFVP